MAKDKRPSNARLKMSDVAELAGVSVSTVSRALAGSALIPDHTREHVLAIANAHGYVVNPFARSLRVQRAHTFGIVIPLGHESTQLISDPFFLEMIGRLADEITLKGYQVLLSKIVAPDRRWLDPLIQSQRADGLFVIGQSTQHRYLNEVAQTYHPLVVWGGKVADQAYCTVGVDNEAGAMTAVRHLIRLGRKRIAFLGVSNLPEIDQRRQGYLRALAEAGLTADPKRIAPAHFTVDTAYDATRRLLDSGENFDGLLAASDVIAIAAIRAIQAHGLRTPEDISVVGFDDLSIASQARPALTTVRQDLERGAKAMVDLMFQRLEGDDAESVVMPAELVIRESCGGAQAL